jgi:hypothetical protein
VQLHPRDVSAEDTRRALADAAAGLVYSSESDYPFEPFAAAKPNEWPMPPRAFARSVGEADAVPATERSLGDFLARHIETSDPYDTRAQAIRPRYEALKGELETRLRDVRVYRVGIVRIRCYVVGLDDAGTLSGLRTTAVET